MKTAKKLLSILFIGALASTATATDYYVTSDGTYEGAPNGAAVYASLDDAIAAAVSSDDVIHVEAGTYSTTTQNGPNLAAKLIGTGASRDKVVIQSDGANRTLRMAAGSWLENVTVVGNTDITKVDKGGAIEMSGGTVTNCVVKSGTANGNNNYKNAGGNLYVNSDAALVVDCEISGGSAKNRGGNVCLDHGTLRDCTITGGSVADGSENNGGNVWTYQGKIEDCTISGGSAVLGGNVYIHNSVASVSGGTISDGTATQGGNLYVNAGAVSGSTISDGTATQGGNLYVKVGTIRGLTCEDGKATGNGGNIYMEGAATIVEGAIRRGTATSKGGNVYMGDGMLQDLEISGGVLTGNVGDGDGGGNIFWNNGRISRCSITGGKLTGTTSLRGGGINCVYTTTANVTRLLEDCLLAENENAAIFCNRSFATYNCSFINNAGASVNSWNPITLDFANCVIFGNTNPAGQTHAWTGNRPVIKNVATDDTSLSNTDGYIAITASAFADYANGDYRPALASALVDAGVDDPRGESASTTDLLGNPRLSGPVDIGCYEYQKTTMSVDIELADSAETVYAPGSVKFNVTATGYPAGQTPTFTVNFGDGSAEVETNDTQVVHEFTTAGTFTVTVQASAAGAFDAEGRLSSLRIASKTIYVKAGNESPAFPYNTPETGYPTVQAAYTNAVDGSEIIVGAGTYDFNGQMQVTNAVAIRGVGANPGDVVFQNTNTNTVLNAGDSYQYRVLEVNNAGARIENITIQNGTVKNQYGANLRLVSGVVSNCVIRGGTAAVSEGGNGAGGGVEIAGAATLTHCVVSNNVVEGTSENFGYTGGAVFIAWEIHNARISNCLIAYNRYETSGETPKAGAAGIHFGGGNDYSSVENCTVVSNVVVGTLNGDSAGISCTTWYGRLRNNIVVGNYETGKGKCTSVKLNFDGGNNYTYANNATDDVVIQTVSGKSTGNILVNSPADIFRDFEHGDFGLRVSCAAYNKGTTSGLYLTPSVDLAGNTRVMFDKKIDIGCYECQKPAGLMILLQ